MNRQGFIGDSDTVKIMSGDWLELWQVKTGRAEPTDLSNNIAVQLGIHTEDFNLNWFEKVYQCKVKHRQRSYSRDVGIVPVVGTVDGLFENNLVEAKHTNGFNSMDDIVAKYMPQVQTYIHMANTEGAYLSVIFGNSKWEAVHVGRDNDYFNSMWAVVSDFWGYFLRDEEPVAIDTPQLSIEKVPVDQMVIRNACTDNAFIDAAHTYIDNQDAARSFESAKKSLKNMVDDNEREVYCDLLSIKRSKNGALRFTIR